MDELLMETAGQNCPRQFKQENIHPTAYTSTSSPVSPENEDRSYHFVAHSPSQLPLQCSPQERSWMNQYVNNNNFCPTGNNDNVQSQYPASPGDSLSPSGYSPAHSSPNSDTSSEDLIGMDEGEFMEFAALFS